MKIKFSSNDELSVNKAIEIPSRIIVDRVDRAVFHENNKYYPQFLLTNVYINYE